MHAADSGSGEHVDGVAARGAGPGGVGQIVVPGQGASADDCTDLADLVDLAVAAGFRPLRIQTATTSEWEHFESDFAAELEIWLLANPGHPENDEVRKKLDSHRRFWLRGHRGVLGFAYLILAPTTHGAA